MQTLDAAKASLLTAEVLTSNRASCHLAKPAQLPPTAAAAVKLPSRGRTSPLAACPPPVGESQEEALHTRAMPIGIDVAKATLPKQATADGTTHAVTTTQRKKRKAYGDAGGVDTATEADSAADGKAEQPAAEHAESAQGADRESVLPQEPASGGSMRRKQGTLQAAFAKAKV